jgi:DNA-binding CsgD family transcriptional regulator
VVAIKAVTSGFAVLPHELLATLVDEDSAVEDFFDRNDAGDALLTPRELEVLAAMADGASNKAIARRLGISFHTAKFHVAAILAKLNADSRTEAVTRAAQLGLVIDNTRHETERPRPGDQAVVRRMSKCRRIPGRISIKREIGFIGRTNAHVAPTCRFACQGDRHGSFPQHRARGAR